MNEAIYFPEFNYNISLKIMFVVEIGNVERRQSGFLLGRPADISSSINRLSGIIAKVRAYVSNYRFTSCIILFMIYQVYFMHSLTIISFFERSTINIYSEIFLNNV